MSVIVIATTPGMTAGLASSVLAPILTDLGLTPTRPDVSPLHARVA